MRDRAILFDRDGTFIVDRSGCSDPTTVELMPQVGDALALAREWDFAVAIVTNQPAGTIDHGQLFALHQRIEQLAGRMDDWFICEPGLVHAAAKRLGVLPKHCVVVGDVGSDIEAARAAGARAILVPTPDTRQEEIEAAPVVARSVLDAVQRVIAGTA